jgi:hypothetical protein
LTSTGTGLLDMPNLPSWHEFFPSKCDHSEKEENNR